MTFAAALTNIGTHLTAAGAALAVPITDVMYAAPVPKGRCIRYFYGGETDPPAFSGKKTLNSQMVGETVLIVAFFPVSSLGETEAASTEDELWDLKDEVRTRIDGDSQLGGACTDLLLGDVEPDFVVIGNTRYRTLNWDLTLAFTEYTLAP
jgi:hypothetical protein